mmetsp:Transcript_22818/g.77716  ORF Transcript_22818/g.77716 Transcript_22818/m.77716 type:complete len:284 (-) Transcript_22818:519-1370(-)
MSNSCIRWPMIRDSPRPTADVDMVDMSARLPSSSIRCVKRLHSRCTEGKLASKCSRNSAMLSRNVSTLPDNRSKRGSARLRHSSSCPRRASSGANASSRSSTRCLQSDVCASISIDVAPTCRRPRNSSSNRCIIMPLCRKPTSSFSIRPPCFSCFLTTEASALVDLSRREMTDSSKTMSLCNMGSDSFSIFPWNSSRSMPQHCSIDRSQEGAASVARWAEPSTRARRFCRCCTSSARPAWRLWTSAHKLSCMSRISPETPSDSSRTSPKTRSDSFFHSPEKPS